MRRDNFLLKAAARNIPITPRVYKPAAAPEFASEEHEANAPPSILADLRQNRALNFERRFADTR